MSEGISMPISAYSHQGYWARVEGLLDSVGSMANRVYGPVMSIYPASSADWSAVMLP